MQPVQSQGKRLIIFLEELVCAGFIQSFLGTGSVSVIRFSMSRPFFVSLILVSKPMHGSSLLIVCASKACSKRIVKLFHLVKK